ncbi:NAD(P)/FAD-dependent oxidoreductase, partial [Microbacterium sp. AGC62]
MRYDAVVIGGGLLGGALTWMLAREGASVLLLEKDQLNQHASGQNAGSLHFQLEYRMVENGWESARTAAAAMPLHLDAAEAWTRLGEELGESVGVVQRGGFMLAETAEQVAVLERKVGLEQEWGLDVTLLDGDEARRIAPY